MTKGYSSKGDLSNFKPNVILLLISDLEYGGAQRQLVELCNNIDKNRYEVHVCSLSNYTPLQEKLSIPPSSFHIIARKHKWDISVIFRLIHLTKKNNVKLIHSFLFDALISSRVCSFFNTKLVIIDSERNCTNTYKFIHRIAYFFTKSRVRMVIANSNAGADFNKRALKMPKAVYKVAHNGVNTKRFCLKNQNEQRLKLDLPLHTFIIGMFASFKKQKNHQFLLHALVNVVKHYPNTHLILVGDELHGGMSDTVSYKASLLKQIKTLGLSRNVSLLGNYPNVEEVYPACDITVLPSLFEGTPNVALESMSCGIPVIATNVSDNSYIIPDLKAGYIVEVNAIVDLTDRILSLLRNEKLRFEMGKYARSWVIQEFSSSKMADKNSSFYDEALSLDTSLDG